MKTIYALTCFLLLVALSSETKHLKDDSIKYVRIDQVYIANQGCNGQWAAMTNFSGNGPNKRIRVYYTVSNRSMVCETSPMPKLPGQKHHRTLLGCWGANYKITRSEYIE